MSDIFDEARRIAGEAARAVLCGAGGVQRVALDTVGKINPLYRGSPLSRLAEAQNRALRSFCPVPPAEDIPIQVPDFEGGQCPEAYNGTWIAEGTAAVGGDFTSSSFFLNVLGPLSVVSGTEDGQQGGKIPFGDIIDGNGVANRVYTGPEFVPPNDLGGFSFTLANLGRVDGGPDNCGNPPPVVPPQPPGSPPPSDPRPSFPDVTINLPDIGPVVGVFAPVVGIIYADIDGRIKIPVTVNVNLPDINANFDIDFNIDLNDPTAEPEPIPRPPKTDDDDRPEVPDCPIPPDCSSDDEEETEEDPDEDETDEKGTEVVSAIVLSVRNADSTRATEIGQTDGPSIWAPAIGYINFVYERLDGGESFGVDLPVKNTNNVIAAPFCGLKCKRVVGTPNQGFDFEIITVTGPRGGCS